MPHEITGDIAHNLCRLGCNTRQTMQHRRNAQNSLDISNAPKLESTMTAAATPNSLEYTPPSSGSSSDPLSVSAEAKASLRILIIDDDRTLREGCASVLQVEGYNVSITGRGDEAMDMAVPTRPSCG